MPISPKKKEFTAFLVFLFAVVCASTLGSYFTLTSVKDWYLTLHKPSYNPPAWVFGPAWTLLYLGIAISGWLLWRRRHFKSVSIPFFFYILQLGLNVAWSGIFFGLRQPAWAFWDIVILWLSILGYIILVWRRSRPAAYLFIPYLLWVSFAALLNWQIIRLNGY